MSCHVKICKNWFLLQQNLADLSFWKKSFEFALTKPSKSNSLKLYTYWKIPDHQYYILYFFSKSRIPSDFQSRWEKNLSMFWKTATAEKEKKDRDFFHRNWEKIWPCHLATMDPKLKNRPHRWFILQQQQALHLHY